MLVAGVEDSCIAPVLMNICTHCFEDCYDNFVQMDVCLPACRLAQQELAATTTGCSICSTLVTGKSTACSFQSVSMMVLPLLTWKGYCIQYLNAYPVT